MHRCGVCGDLFDTDEEYCDHKCKKTGFTPKDRTHIKKAEEMYRQDPDSLWQPVPGKAPRRPLSKVPRVPKKKKGFWERRRERKAMKKRRL